PPRQCRTRPKALRSPPHRPVQPAGAPGRRQELVQPGRQRYAAAARVRQLLERGDEARLRGRILSGIERDHLVSYKALDEPLDVFGSRGLPPAPVEPEPARRRPRTAPLVHLLG